MLTPCSRGPSGVVWTKLHLAGVSFGFAGRPVSECAHLTLCDIKDVRKKSDHI